jgi:hypothetical protein
MWIGVLDFPDQPEADVAFTLMPRHCARRVREWVVRIHSTVGEETPENGPPLRRAKEVSKVLLLGISLDLMLLLELLDDFFIANVRH